jgi:hypothetical protein
VEFFRSPFLVQELEVPLKHGKIKETLRLKKSVVHPQGTRMQILLSSILGIGGHMRKLL